MQIDDDVLREVEAALYPFSDMAGEMFARNWHLDQLALALDNPRDPHRLFFTHFNDARTALARLRKAMEDGKDG